MKTKIRAENPFGPDRYGFLWELLRGRPPGDHLDYGSYDGRVISTLVRTGVITTGVGVDVNKSIVSQHAPGLPEGVSLLPISKNEPLPFADGTFHSASALDVIEHVHNQAHVLKELHRVLKPNGLLVVTVPRRYFLSFLDLGNWKFVFPTLHRWYYSLVFSRGAYTQRYVNSENGLIRDIEIEKGWHQHFREHELCELLLDHGFQIQQVDGSALFSRLITAVSRCIPRRFRRGLGPLMCFDARRFAQANLFCAAIRG